jgi:hypothetical protein
MHAHTCNAQVGLHTRAALRWGCTHVQHSGGAAHTCNAQVGLHTRASTASRTLTTSGRGVRGPWRPDGSHSFMIFTCSSKDVRQQQH